MTMQNILLVIGAALFYGVLCVILGFRRNIAIAKASNLPYLVVRKSKSLPLLLLVTVSPSVTQFFHGILFLT